MRSVMFNWCFIVSYQGLRVNFMLGYLFYVLLALGRLVWAVLVVVLLVVMVLALLAAAAGPLPAAGVSSNDGVVEVLRGCRALGQGLRNSLPPCYY